MPAFHVYGNSIAKQVTGSIDLDTDTFKALLVTAAYTPDLDAHDFLNDANANEVTGTGYTAGGKTLATVTVTIDAVTNEVRFSCANITWTSLDITSAGARYMIFYKSRGGLASADELLCYLDLDSDRDPAGNNLVITMPATGLFKYIYS